MKIHRWAQINKIEDFSREQVESEASFLNTIPLLRSDGTLSLKFLFLGEWAYKGLPLLF